MHIRRKLKANGVHYSRAGATAKTTRAEMEYTTARHSYMGVHFNRGPLGGQHGD